jgi:hypothetical protein
MDARLWKAVRCRFGRSDIGGAIEFLEERLAKEKVARFKGLLKRRFTNSPRSILSAINKFMDACSTRFPIEAVYLEMNGFGPGDGTRFRYPGPIRGMTRPKQRRASCVGAC